MTIGEVSDCLIANLSPRGPVKECRNSAVIRQSYEVMKLCEVDFCMDHPHPVCGNEVKVGWIGLMEWIGRDSRSGSQLPTRPFIRSTVV